ncbi:MULTISPECIES: hypothetical protein [Bacillus cereus group]|uniref:hypothetical protein n=1 Tax=Bacillus cereus group TaxID=86661 RepID=UPI000BFBE8CD|nr:MULTISPECIES: hypothetical protein [Bacillus cereus group]PGR69443.1 hypothetical protein COC49_01840 [Bacillus cereus]PGS79716.1 hypothetical protein COD02_27270 [Bacillus thuringiensis]
MLVLIDSFLKSPPGFVALISGFITLTYFIATRLIQVLVTDEINKLFLSKVQQVNLKIWHFLTAVIYFTILFAGSGLAFNYSFNEVDFAKSGFFHNLLFWSFILFFISLLIVLLSPAIVKKFKKFTRIIILLIMFNMILGLVIYCFVFNQITYIKVDLNNLSIVVLLPLILVSLYSFIFSKINSQKLPIKYRIKPISEDKLKIEKLIHGHIIDEKRTICFPKDSTDKDIFYLCDFSAEIYLKYEKEEEHEDEDEDNKFALSSTNQKINRKIYNKKTY